MSSFTERWRARLLRRRTAAIAGLVLLVLTAVTALAGLRGPGDVLNPLKVERADLVLTVDIEGELAAVRSTDVGAPPVTEVEFKISLLAPEGSAVKKGQPILGFDTEALQRQLVDKQAELAEFTKKVEQKEVDLRLKLMDLEQQTAQAET